MTGKYLVRMSRKCLKETSSTVENTPSVKTILWLISLLLVLDEVVAMHGDVACELQQIRMWCEEHAKEVTKRIHSASRYPWVCSAVRINVWGL